MGITIIIIAIAMAYPVVSYYDQFTEYGGVSADITHIWLGLWGFAGMSGIILITIGIQERNEVKVNENDKT